MTKVSFVYRRKTTKKDEKSGSEIYGEQIQRTLGSHGSPATLIEFAKILSLLVSLSVLNENVLIGFPMYFDFLILSVFV